MKQFLILFFILISVSIYAQEVTVKHPLTNKAHYNKTNGSSINLLNEAEQVPVSSQDKKTESQKKYTVTTLAGQNLAGNTDGNGFTALLSSPSSIAIDAKGSLYVADAINNTIRKISPDGVVTTFAGKQTAGRKDGLISEATFHYPTGVAIDCKGNLYVADKGNHIIRKISPGGIVSTLAGSGVRSAVDGPAIKACFDKPVAVAVDSACNVYVADAANHKIRKITPTGTVSTLAGSGELGSFDGKGIIASFYNPSGLAVDASGNVYVADHDNNRIRKISADGNVTTIAGSDTTGNTDGLSSKATFFCPSNIALDAAGNLYITDQVNHKIRRLSTTGEVTTLAGNGMPGASDGNGMMASFNYPSGIAVDSSGNIYVADQLNCKIRKMIPVVSEIQMQ